MGVVSAASPEMRGSALGAEDSLELETSNEGAGGQASPGGLQEF